MNNPNYIIHNKIEGVKNAENTEEAQNLLRKGTRLPKQENYESKYSHNRKKAYNDEYKKYNHHTNKHHSKKTNNEFPSIPDYINPSPIPFTEPYKNNNRMNNKPIPFSGMDDDIYAQPNPFWRNNEGNINNSITGRRDNHHMNIEEMKKEISSEALDGLNNFNIGKELEPDPEIVIEK